MHDGAVIRPHIAFGTCFAFLLKVSVPRDVDGGFPHSCGVRAYGPGCSLSPQEVHAHEHH